jgi:ribosomal protein S18 acetylase RimI-like enzyme
MSVDLSKDNKEPRGQGSEQSAMDPAQWVLRPYTPDDVRAIAIMQNAALEAEGSDIRVTAEELRERYSRPGFEPDGRTVIAERTADKSIAGVGRYMMEEQTGGAKLVYRLLVMVHPDNRGSGLERELASRVVDMVLDHGRETGRAADRKDPDDARGVQQIEGDAAGLSGVAAQSNKDTGDALVRAFVPGREPEMVALCQACGMEKVREWYVMDFPIGETIEKPNDIEGVEIRTFRYPEDNEEALNAILDSFAEHFDFDLETEKSSWQYWNNASGTRHDLSWLAQTPQVTGNQSQPPEIVALCLAHVFGGEKEETGQHSAYIMYVGTRPLWRHKGIARSLLLRTLNSLREANIGTISLEVDATNQTGAVQLYRSVGFKVKDTSSQYDCLLSNLKPLPSSNPT